MRRGLTLLELIVAVGVVALLLAISLPVLGAVRLTARETECLSQIRQTGLLMNSYATDHRGRLPQVGEPRLTRSFSNEGYWMNYFDQQMFWPIALRGYAAAPNDPRELTCPYTEIPVIEREEEFDSQFPEGAVLPVVYWYSSALFTRAALWRETAPVVDASQLLPVNISEVAHPSAKAAFYELAGRHRLVEPPLAPFGEDFDEHIRPYYRVPVALVDGSAALKSRTELPGPVANPFYGGRPPTLFNTRDGFLGRDF
jgi:prepilin-type N-terminal cleavage/methylation domain-containing protein